MDDVRHYLKVSQNDLGDNWWAYEDWSYKGHGTKYVKLENMEGSDLVPNNAKFALVFQDYDTKVKHSMWFKLLDDNCTGSVMQNQIRFYDVIKTTLQNTDGCSDSEEY